MSALSCRRRRLRPAAGEEGRSWTRSQIEGRFPIVPSLGSVAEIPCRASKKPASQSDRSFPLTSTQAADDSRPLHFPTRVTLSLEPPAI